MRSDSAIIPTKKGAENRLESDGDKEKPGTKRHLVVDKRGIPLLCVMMTAANVNDSMVFEEEILDAIEPIKRPRGRPRKRPEKLHTDKAYDDDRQCA